MSFLMIITSKTEDEKQISRGINRVKCKFQIAPKTFSIMKISR